MIYVCSPYRGDIEKNTAFARKCCKSICNSGEIPIAPHLYFTQFLDDTDDRERKMGMQFGLQLLDLCCAVWVFGNTISEGMKAEIEYAIQHGKVVKYIGS